MRRCRPRWLPGCAPRTASSPCTPCRGERAAGSAPGQLKGSQARSLRSPSDEVFNPLVESVKSASPDTTDRMTAAPLAGGHQIPGDGAMALVVAAGAGAFVVVSDPVAGPEDEAVAPGAEGCAGATSSS